MRAWRIFDQNRSWARRPDFDPLDGIGGLHDDGRWHHKGNRILYAAGNSSLALLERVVHIVPSRFGEQTMLELDIPDDTVETVSHEQLVQLLRDGEDGARQRPTRDHGTRWAKEQRTLVLVAPSIVNPFDQNVVLNPVHPRMADVRIVRSERVRLDGRLIVLEGL